MLPAHIQGPGSARSNGRRGPRWAQRPPARERPRSGCLHPLLGSGSDPLGGECLRFQNGAVNTLAPLSIKASSLVPPTPRPQPPESFSSSSSICLLTDRGGAMTQPRRAPGAQSHTSPGPEGAVGCGCHLRWGQGPLSGGSYDSSLEGSLDLLFGGCMNSNVGMVEPRVCTGKTPPVWRTGLAEALSKKARFPLEASQFPLPPSAWHQCPPSCHGPWRLHRPQ